ncbi:MAG: hypothetical protein RL660_1639 [Bacteroidota bacterium]|jgi:predicted nucleotidyltransferase
MHRLKPHKKDITTLCKTHSVKSLDAFGSVFTENFASDSDIDLIVDFVNVDIGNYADKYFDFKFSLQNTLRGKSII